MPLVANRQTITGADLIKFYPPPEHFVSDIQASTDYNTIISQSYVEGLDLKFFMEECQDKPNDNLYSAYKTQCDNWDIGGIFPRPDPVPSAPLYKKVDVDGFKKWYNAFCANLGKDAPEVDFITTIIPDHIVYLQFAVNPTPQPTNPIGLPIPSSPGFFYPAAGDITPNLTNYTSPDGKKYQKLVSPFAVPALGQGEWQLLP